MWLHLNTVTLRLICLFERSDMSVTQIVDSNSEFAQLPICLNTGRLTLTLFRKPVEYSFYNLEEFAYFTTKATTQLINTIKRPIDWIDFVNQTLAGKEHPGYSVRFLYVLFLSEIMSTSLRANTLRIDIMWNWWTMFLLLTPIKWA